MRQPSRLWAGLEDVMKVIRRWHEEVNEKSFGDVLKATRDETHQNRLISFDMAKELCGYILHRMPEKLAAICVGVEDLNGYEAFMSREEDPVLETAQLQVALEVNKLGSVRCKSH